MNILYIDIDSARPDHFGCHGYHRNTTPTIDAIAAEGVRFENVHCSDAPCLPSRTSLFAGRFGRRTGVVNHGGVYSRPRDEGVARNFHDRLHSEALPSVLRRAGYRTATISTFAERHSAWHWLAGFNEVYNCGKRGDERADEVGPPALDWLQRNAKGSPWFLHVNFWDPHTPLRTPLSFGDPFKDDPIPEWITPEVLERQRQHPGPHGPQDLCMYGGTLPKNMDKDHGDGVARMLGSLEDMDDVKRLFDGYDTAVRYVDSYIERIVGELERQGLLDDTAIIVSADHGENLGELNLYSEHGTADLITTHVPMIVRWPGGRKGAVDKGLHYHFDMNPTICDLIGAKKPEKWDGRSYAGAINGDGAPGRDELIVGQCAHVCQRSVRFGDHLYMRTYHDGYHLFPDEMLYNVIEDPHESTDLATSEPALVEDARKRLAAWEEEMRATAEPGEEEDPLHGVLAEGGPFHTRTNTKAWAKRLEETGRSAGLARLKEKHPAAFGD